MRDRLIELLKETFEYTRGTCIDFDEAAEINADNLLENGVVVIDTDVVSPPNRPLISQYMGRPIDEVINLIRRSEWISVDERLPEGNGRFLLVDSEGYMLVATWYTDGGWFMPFCHGNAITHWMPLPEPPMMKGGAE